MRYYTGIGSRTIPRDILNTMRKLSNSLCASDWILRSGGADGADTAFEKGSTGAPQEIYLPWKNFNKNSSTLYDIPDKAFRIAENIWDSSFPASWKYLKPPTKKFMARNVMQVLGKDLFTPSAFVICWTPDGCETKQDRTKITGGTGQAIALGNHIGIPIFNLFNEGSLEKLYKCIEDFG